jgi:hypothetical protein
MRLFALLLLLTACQPPPISGVLPAFAQYTPKQQRQMKADYDALPPDPSTRAFRRR